MNRFRRELGASLLMASLLLVRGLEAQEAPVDLISAGAPQGGWSFSNGAEFPGATGDLALEAAGPGAPEPALRLSGDFTRGGAYVQASTDLPAKPARSLVFRVKAPGAGKLTLRLVDGSGQCHQIGLRLDRSPDWQEVRFPIGEFFRRMAEGASIDRVAQYEKWGGAGDSRWHDPGKLLAILVGADTFPGTKKGSIWLSGVSLAPGAPSVQIEKAARLDDLLQAGEVDWTLGLGEEFPGAKGSLRLAPDRPGPGSNGLSLEADFTGGGAYVAADRSLRDVGAEEVRAIRFKMRSETVESFSVRLVDGTGQCHQKKGFAFVADGGWHEVVLRPGEFAGVEHWGGANDGAWHGTAQELAILVFPGSNPRGKRCALELAELSADVRIRAEAEPAAYAEGFEEGDPLPAGWTAKGSARRVRDGAWKGKGALALERTLEQIGEETRATGAPFRAAEGLWRLEGASKGALHSPDNSYAGVIRLEALDAAGAVLERIEVRSAFGTFGWEPFDRQAELPPRTAAARFTVSLEKTYGSFCVDELSAARISSDEKRVDRIVLSSDRMGNLFFPEDAPRVHASVEAARGLRPSEQRLRYVVTDYWGVEQGPVQEVPLVRQGRTGGRFTYGADLRLDATLPDVGRYYELHVEVPVLGRPAREHTGVARLALAATKSLRPEEVPFTIRNWDSRIPEYFFLADRLGIRQLGLWAGWPADRPADPYLPGVDEVRKLGAGWVGGIEGAGWVESDGWKRTSEENLRTGLKAWIRKFGPGGRIMICLGNEPHGARPKVKENVRAYRALYEAAKEADPSIFVVGTSVEPNRDYFEEGYFRYLDAYDFHVYESYLDVRRTIREYKALMREFHAEKPILSTELGLNSQGQTRLAVACELVKKAVSLYAEGGVSASWFTIQYPDPDGKARGQAGDAHCMFDCKYSRYNPRLDAITCATFVNGLGAKRFVAERQYPGGAGAYLFRDLQGRAMQVLWTDGARQAVSVLLPRVAELDLVRVDGARSRLLPRGGAVTIDLSPEPVFLFYSDPSGGLGERLGEPSFQAASAPAAGLLRIRGSAVRVVPPPRWTSDVRAAGGGITECRITPAGETEVREVRAVVRATDDSGEIVVPVPLGH